MNLSGSSVTSFRKKNKPSGEMALQITAMADIMVVILVFMLKSYASGAMVITPTAGMTLPASQADEAYLEALKVEVSKDAVLVEGNPVTTLKDFVFEKSDLRENHVLTSLGNALKKERQRQLTIAQVNEDVKIDAKILIIADQEAPYRLIKAVLASAAVNGYTDFKLAVIRKDG